MVILLAVIGTVLGAALFQSVSGALFGAGFGALAGFVHRLTRRVARAEAKLDQLRRDFVFSRQTRTGELDRPESAPEPAPRPQFQPAPPPPAPAPSRATPPVEPTRTAPGPGEIASAPRPAVRRPVRVSAQPDLFDRAVAFAKGWISTGNVPVKLGVVVSLFGVAFLIKEAVDRELLSFPIEMRLISVALVGAGLLVLGWHLRERERVYALSIQGGGISILYLTAYAAFALYHLLPAGLAFGLLVLITVAAGALAVRQDSRVIAVLGIVGGFLAPVLVSTGTGDHVTLFGYYVVLNAAVLGVSWFKSWRELNLLGFLFTFAIGGLWGYRAYQPAHFATTEPFLITFFAMYAAISILFTVRQPAGFKGFVDGTLVFGTPIVAFGLQARLVADTEYGLAASALVLAAFYGAVAVVLRRANPEALRRLIQSCLVIAVVFLALAVPLALDARWTSAAWALQGAGLIWVGLGQKQRFSLLLGAVLQFGAGVSYFAQAPAPRASWPLLNSHFLGAALIAVAGWVSSWLFDRGREDASAWHRIAAWILLGWGAAWWFGAGLVQIERHAAADLEVSAALGFVAASIAVLVAVSPRVHWRRLNIVGIGLLPAMGFALLVTAMGGEHPLANYGWLAWPAALLVQYKFLQTREAQLAPICVAPLHAGTYWVVSALLAWEASWLVDRWAGGVWPGGIWPGATALAVLSLTVYLTLAGRERIRWPVGAHWRTYLAGGSGPVMAAALGSTLMLNLVSPAAAAPLPYLPLLNPLELASVWTLVVFVAWFAAGRGELSKLSDYRGVAPAITVGLGFVILTMTVARAVHHWAGVPFTLQGLTGSGILQTALSIVWAVVALGGMVSGARRAARPVWIAGAALMGVVVVKLFLVELDNTGTLARIVSFIGVGALLLVVGYFAPVPPRERETAVSPSP